MPRAAPQAALGVSGNGAACQSTFFASRLRPTMAAAAAPNSSSIGGAGTSCPPLVPPLVPPDVELEVDELVELEVEELVLDDVDELVEVDDVTLPEDEDVEVTLPDEVEVEE